MAKRTRMTLPALMVLAACAGSPANTGYEIADFHARWLDQFQVDKHACERTGGVIVQDRRAPDSIRVGRAAPEAGTRYWCAR